MSDIPKIELKSIKVNNALSQETFCYSAKLFVDGVHVCDVGNAGHGGCDEFLAPGKGLDYGESYRLYDAIAARVKTEWPQSNLASDGEPPMMVEESLEGLCGGLVAEHMIEKDVKSDLRRNVVFYREGLPAKAGVEELRLFKINDAKGHTLVKLSEHVRKQNPRAVILNEMPLDEAVKAYKLAA